MPYSDMTEYPRGVASGNLASAVTIAAAGQYVKVGAMVFGNATTPPGTVRVDVTNAAGTTVYARFNITNERGFAMNKGFTAPDGLRLEAIPGVAGGNVDYGVFYYSEEP